MLQLYAMGLTMAQIAEHWQKQSGTIRKQLGVAASKLRIGGATRRQIAARVFGYAPTLPHSSDQLARILDS